MRYNKVSTLSEIQSVEKYEGETIEERMRRVTLSGEPIEDTAPIIYTERSEGVKPEHDIRTDKWERATEACDIFNKNQIAKSNEADLNNNEETSVTTSAD